MEFVLFFFFSSRRRHTSVTCDWSSDVCSSDLPAGGGRFCAEIHPVKALKGLQIGERGEITLRRAIGVVANLPRHIAQRELETVGKMLNWGPECFSVEESRNSAGPRNIVMIEIGSREVT